MRLQPAALMSEPTWPSDDEEMILLDNLLLVTCNRVSDRRQLRLDCWCLWSVLRVMDSVVTVIYSHLVCIPASRLPTLMLFLPLLTAGLIIVSLVILYFGPVIGVSPGHILSSVTRSVL